MTKVSAPYLYRKRGIYYLQKRIPKPLIPKYGRSILQRSLRTTNRADAVRLSSSIVSSLEREWQALLFDIPNTSASAFYHLTSGQQQEPLLTEAMQHYLKDGGKDLDFRLCQATNTVIKSVVSLVGDKTLSAYSRNDALRFRDTLVAKGVAQATVKRHFARVRAIWNFSAREHGIMTTNPFANMNLGGGKAPRKRHPIPTENIFNIQTLCSEIDDDMRWIVATISDSGMRLAEVIGLQKDDLSLDVEIPFLRLSEHPWRRLKTSTSKRDVPLVGAALWGLKRALDKVKSMGCVRKRGKSWNAQVRIAGWRSFTKSFKSKSDAVCWVQQTEYQLKNTFLPLVDVGDTTLRELLQTYAKEVSSHLKGSEIEIYKLNLYSKHPIAENKLVNLAQRHFEYLRDERLKQVKSGTVHADLMMFRRVFKTAIHKWGYGLPKNPVEYLQLPSPHKSRKRRLMPSEKERLLTAASSQRNIYIASIIEFAIETGMRRSEILKLKWCDVDLENGFASLYDTKNGEDRRAPLTRKCIEVLKTVRQTHEEMFPISATCLRLAWNRARKKAGISDLRFHDLRHEAVSRFFEMGLSVPEVALISGHKDVRQLFRYTHLNPENVFKKYQAF